MGPRVLISDRMDSGVVDVLEGIKGVIVDENTELTPKELLGVIGEYDGLIVRSSTKVTEDVIQAGKRLRVIGRAGAGVDNIDVDYAKENGIRLSFHPGPFNILSSNIMSPYDTIVESEKLSTAENKLSIILVFMKFLFSM